MSFLQDFHNSTIANAQSLLNTNVDMVSHIDKSFSNAGSIFSRLPFGGPGAAAPGNNSSNYSSPSTPQTISYIDAPYAEAYGMSAETAYQEALANSAYQRKVADLKKAGLNPVLGIDGAGAASFRGDLAGSSGYGSIGSGKTTSESGDIWDKLSYGLPLVLNGLTNIAFTTKTGNSMAGFGAGMVAQNISSGAINLIRSFID